MRHRSISCFGVIALVLCAGAAPPAAPVPTTEEIYASFEQADYPQTLKGIAAALAVKGDTAARYDRHELLVLRGETQLRMKNVAAAAASFDEAAKTTKDEVKAAVDLTTAELLRRAKGPTYAPPVKKGAPAPEPIDLTDPLKRKDTFATLFEESKPRVAAAAKAAARSGRLPAMADVIPLLRDLAVLETAATGEAAESAELARVVASRAATVMAPAVKDMGKTVAELEEFGMRVYQDNVQIAGRVQAVESGPVGLTRDQVEQLVQIKNDCRRVAELAGRLKSLFTGGEEADALRAVRDEADNVERMARELAAVRWDQYRNFEGPYAGYGADRPVGRTDRPGTSAVQRPARRGNPAAGPRGVGTGGVGSGTR